MILRCLLASAISFSSITIPPDGLRRRRPGLTIVSVPTCATLTCKWRALLTKIDLSCETVQVKRPVAAN